MIVGSENDNDNDAKYKEWIRHCKNGKHGIIMIKMACILSLDFILNKKFKTRCSTMIQNLIILKIYSLQNNVLKNMVKILT